MSSLFKKPQVRPDLGRNGFDMSRRRCFTSPCGMLLPVYHDFANPGEKYKLNSSSFIRTEALQTAAMMRLKAHVDWFFVPITQLYSRWNEFFNGTDDIMSSIFSTKNGPDAVFNTLPTYPLTNVLNFEDDVTGTIESGRWIMIKHTQPDDTTVMTPTIDSFGVPYLWNFRRLFDLLGYGSVTGYKADTDKVFTFLPFLAYHKIWHSHYNLTDWFKNDPYMYNVDYCYKTNRWDTLVAARILGTIHYRPWRKDLFTDLMPQPMFSSSFASFIQNSFTNYGVGLRGVINPEVTRATNSVNGSSANVLANRQANTDPSNSVSGLISSPILSGTDASIPFNLSAADVRSLFAYDKLLRVTAFAGGHYEDQTLSHFGYKMPEGISKEVYFIGSQSTDISINEVVATASTRTSEGSATTVKGAGTVIGDIAGKAFGATQGSSDLNFECPCHGFIMAIFSIEPIPEYASMGLEVQNRCQTSLDYYHPELDNVGMQPAYGDFYYPDSTAVNADSITGWQYRYMQFKSSFDVVNEGFYATDKSTWVGFKQSIYNLRSIYTTVVPLANRFFIAPQYTNNVFLQTFPFNPTSVNPDQIGKPNPQVVPGYFLNDDTPNFKNEFFSPMNVYKGDNFLVNTDFKVYKTSTMSVHSLPKMI